LKFYNSFLFTLLCLSIVLVTILLQRLLNLEQLFVDNLYDQLSSDQINSIIRFNRNWDWLGYLLLPILFIFKIALVAKILDAGVFFIEKEISYSKLFSVVLRAEFIFIGIPIFKLLWFYFIQKEFTLQDVQTFYPLSLLNFGDYTKVDVWFLYPLQALNVFEVLYWLFLSFHIKKILNIPFYQAFNSVMLSYGICFFIWVIAIMFLYLNMT